MQTLFVGPDHTPSLSFIPSSGDQPVADAHFTRQENAPVAQQDGKQPFNRLFYFTMKRLLDLTVTLLALGLLWPLLLLIVHQDQSWWRRNALGCGGDDATTNCTGSRFAFPCINFGQPWLQPSLP